MLYSRKTVLDPLFPGRCVSDFKSIIFKFTYSYRIVAGAIALKLLKGVYYRTSLMGNQHWFRQWLGAVTWAKVDPDLCCHMVSLGGNELKGSCCGREGKIRPKNHGHGSCFIVFGYGWALTKQLEIHASLVYVQRKHRQVKPLRIIMVDMIWKSLGGAVSI